MRVFISSKPESLRALRPDATVEAEYGLDCVEGRVVTLAHHGPRAGNPAPCCAEAPVVVGDAVVGVSHIDLDTVGGIMGLLGRRPRARGFWRLAAFVDVNGPHKLGLAGATNADERRLHAYWAFAQTARVFAPRDGSAKDVTEKVLRHVAAVERILRDDPEMLAAGEVFRREGEALNARSFFAGWGDVIVRAAPAFTNHLYTDPQGAPREAVVAFNPALGSVTVSFADTPEGVSACAIVQDLWGPLAGGHRGIAGSPRGQRMTLADALDAANAVLAALNG